MEKLEEFVPLKDYEGIYQINRLGKIKALERRITIKHRNLCYKEKILKNNLSNQGYEYVNLWKDGIKKIIKIHRAIAQTFIPNLNNKPFVNHINGIKTDNRVENLEWVTSSENIKHAYILGLRKPKSKKVVCGVSGKVWNSIKDCAEETLQNSTTLSSKIKKGKSNIKYFE